MNNSPRQVISAHPVINKIFRHGLYCLGCCWALMLVMFTTGVGHFTLMLLLTGVMVAEKTSSWSRVLVPIVGIALLVWGTLTLLYPGTLA